MNENERAAQTPFSLPRPSSIPPFSFLFLLDISIWARGRVCFASKAFLDIELKVAGLEKRTCEIVGAYLPEKGYVISSFLPGVLRELHAMSGAMQLGLICERRDQLALWDKLPLTHLMPHHKLLTESLAIEVHGANGYSNDYPVERYLRNCKAAVIYEGTRDIHTLMQADWALGLKKEKPARKTLPPWRTAEPRGAVAL